MTIPPAMTAFLRDWKFLLTLLGGITYGLWHGIVWADNAIESIEKVPSLEKLIHQHEQALVQMRERDVQLNQEQRARDEAILRQLEILVRNQSESPAPVRRSVGPDSGLGSAPP